MALIGGVAVVVSPLWAAHVVLRWGLAGLLPDKATNRRGLHRVALPALMWAGGFSVCTGSIELIRLLGEG